MKAIFFTLFLLSTGTVQAQLPRTTIGNATALDAAGNVYTVGNLKDTVDFDPGAGVHLVSAGKKNDNPFLGIYVSKLDASGGFVWAKAFADSASGTPQIAVDATGNIYVAGAFFNTQDFDPGPGTSLLTSAGQTDIFIMKMDGSGNLLWVQHIGGPNLDLSAGLVVDAGGNVYTTGRFSGTVDFDPGAGVSNLSTPSASITGAFVTKLDASGALVWVRQLATSANASGTCIALTATGNVYTAGIFTGTADFDPSAATANKTSSGLTDAFIWALDAAGNYVWAGAIGGPGTTADNELIRSLAADDADNVYACGYSFNMADYDPGPGVQTLSSTGHSFVLKLDNGGAFQWAKPLLGSSTITSVKAAASGVFATGYATSSADFNPGTATDTFSANGSFVWKLDAAGAYSWAVQLAASRYFDDITTGRSQSLALDASENVQLTGSFYDTVDFDPGVATFGMIGPAWNSSVGTQGRAAYVLKLTSTGSFIWAKQFGGTSQGTASVPWTPALTASLMLAPVPAVSISTLYSNELLKDANVRLHTMHGQVVAEWRGVNGFYFPLDVSGLATGMYIVEVQQGNAAQRLRLMKQ